MSQSPIHLVCLAPTAEVQNTVACRLADDLAAILNSDQGLPGSIRQTSSRSLETKETVLSYTKEWCLKRNARFYAIALGEGRAIGAISLSHINFSQASAFCGYWIGSTFQGKGYGFGALTQLMERAKGMGLIRVSAQIIDDNIASKRLWKKLGASFEQASGKIVATASLA
ncbi:MAG: GNAT family N-acetyltransferase [Alphaproteobacteria bacterium]|nr:GNAT family N-acetyltransferase [Alphaproteobacteria bacterium]